MSEESPNIAALARTVRPDVVGAIRQASAQTGVDFAYLLEKAGAESGFDPQAQAGTSSARGLYQFIDSTWLDTLERHGARHGYPNAAAAITRDGSGRPVVASDEARDYLLALRDNPRISALMAAEFARDNEQKLEQSLGREVGSAELYMAHFLGARGAAKFLGEMAMNGGAAASAVVPAAAQANAAVFYAQGQALSLDAVYERLAGKFGADLPGAAPDNPGVKQVPGGAAPPFPAADPSANPATRAAIIAAADPSFAALQALQVTYANPETGTPPAVRAGTANQLMALSLLQAFANGEGDESNEWVV